MTPTKQINVRLPLELHKALADHHVRTGEQKSDVIRRGIEIALSERAVDDLVGEVSATKALRIQNMAKTLDLIGKDTSDSSTPSEEPKPDPPTTAEDSVDIVVWLAGRTGMPRTLCVRAKDRGRITVAGHVWTDNCVSKADLDKVCLDGEPV